SSLTSNTVSCGVLKTASERTIKIFCFLFNVAISLYPSRYVKEDRQKNLTYDTVPTTCCNIRFRYKRRILGNFQKSFNRLISTPSFCFTKEHFNIMASQVMFR